MPDTKLVGQNYTTPDLIAKVTGRAKYAEDYRADGMLFTKLLLSPMPHARVVSIDARAALATAGVRAILTADDLPDLRGAERALTNEPLYQGEPILAVAAVDERTAAEAVEKIEVHLEPLPCWAHLSAEEYRGRIAELVADVEGQAALKRVLLGQPAKGVAAVREQEPHAAPERLKKSPAPRFHAASRKIRRELYESYRHFLAAFREAAARLRAGELAVVFPAVPQ